MVKVIQEYSERFEFEAVHAGVMNGQKLLASDSFVAEGRLLSFRKKK
jgi:hypothetical protein